MRVEITIGLSFCLPRPCASTLSNNLFPGYYLIPYIAVILYLLIFLVPDAVYSCILYLVVSQDGIVRPAGRWPSLAMYTFVYNKPNSIARDTSSELFPRSLSTVYIVGKDSECLEYIACAMSLFIHYLRARARNNLFPPSLKKKQNTRTHTRTRRSITHGTSRWQRAIFEGLLFRDLPKRAGFMLPIRVFHEFALIVFGSIHLCKWIIWLSKLFSKIRENWELYRFFFHEPRGFRENLYLKNRNFIRNLIINNECIIMLY